MSDEEASLSLEPLLSFSLSSPEDFPELPTTRSPSIASDRSQGIRNLTEELKAVSNPPNLERTSDQSIQPTKQEPMSAEDELDSLRKILQENPELLSNLQDKGFAGNEFLKGPSIEFDVSTPLKRKSTSRRATIQQLQATSIKQNNAISDQTGTGSKFHEAPSTQPGVLKGTRCSKITVNGVEIDVSDKPQVDSTPEPRLHSADERRNYSAKDKVDFKCSAWICPSQEQQADRIRSYFRRNRSHEPDYEPFGTAAEALPTLLQPFHGQRLFRGHSHRCSQLERSCFNGNLQSVHRLSTSSHHSSREQLRMVSSLLHRSTGP